MAMGSLHGGGLLVQLFCTNGNCMLVAPVVEFTRNPCRFAETRLAKLGFAVPAMVGYPPLQLASPGTVAAPGSATQFGPGGGKTSAHPPLAFGTKIVPP